jgi:hypothetical protein
VKKLRRQQIATKEGTNAFLRQRYLADHDRRFARAAAADEDFHSPAMALCR